MTIQTLQPKIENGIIIFDKPTLFSGVKAMDTYRGYATNDPYKAAELYKSATGYEATVIVARPEFVITDDHPLVIRSRLGTANGLLVSHLISVDEMNRHQNSLPAVLLTHKADDDERPSLSRGKYNIVPEKKPGRPSQKGGACPHCGSEVTDFSKLGFWYGWQLGIVPPYWESLRLYVFQRDNYTCQDCHQRLSVNKLRCHHIQKKEDGGTDSALNLRTLCGDCHSDEHPIMPEDEEENY